MNGMAADEKLGLGEPEKKETIIVDFGGANVAKPLHVGHLRSAVSCSTTAFAMSICFFLYALAAAIAPLH